MRKKSRFSVTLVFIFLLVSFFVRGEVKTNPVAVSPGSDSEAVLVWQTCPTFSWSPVFQAASYRVAVFEVTDSKTSGYEDMPSLTQPVVTVDLPGPALSWTLSSDKSLKPGSMYTWYVQALDSSGNAVGGWSNGRIFKVGQETPFTEVEKKLPGILKSNGVNDGTITNVIKDLKSQVKTNGSFVPNTGIVKGYEGGSNTFYGHNAGYSDPTGDYNSFFGANSGALNTIGYSNTYIGYGAGVKNTEGNRNTAVGTWAASFYSYGSSNSAFGAYAGEFNTGNNNTFIGEEAGMNSSVGSYNTLIGCLSGNYNGSGTYNVFLGYSAGFNNSANYNTLIGNQSGENSSGSYNTFLGNYAGRNNTGSYNTFLGNWAGLSNTANYNTFIGHWTGRNNTTGTDNIFLGRYTGYNNTTGYDNTFVGSVAGFQNFTGNGNVFIGFQAGYAETGSNKLYINNSAATWPLLYGEFDTNLVSVRGQLGVGIKIPLYPVHVSNGAYCSTGGTWTNASSRDLKENIADLGTEEAEDALTGLIPVKYNYKADKNEKHVGFIAEDAPELVATQDRKGMSPMDVVAVLTKVLQEQQKVNREQQRVNQEQQKIISDLQERIKKLEKK